MAVEMLTFAAAVLYMVQRKVDYFILWGIAVTLQAAVTLLNGIRGPQQSAELAAESPAKAKAARTV